MATTTAKKKGIHFAWFVLIGVLLMMGLCRGGINSGMGLFFQPISADMHIGVGEVAMMSSISALITMFWSPFAGRLLDKFDIRIITVVAVAIQAGCRWSTRCGASTRWPASWRSARCSPRSWWVP